MHRHKFLIPLVVAFVALLGHSTFPRKFPSVNIALASILMPATFILLFRRTSLWLR